MIGRWLSKSFLKLNVLRKKFKNRYYGSFDYGNNLVYGGDLRVPTSTESFGKILFDRLSKIERQDKVFQICTATRQSMTTGEYLEKSVAMAEKLRESGVKKGDYIVLASNNSLNLTIALAGIFFTGAIPVPLSHKTKAEDTSNILKFCKPKFVGCDRKNLYKFKRTTGETANFDVSKTFLLGNEREWTEPKLSTFREFIDRRYINTDVFEPEEVEDPFKETALVMKALTEEVEAKLVGITHYNLNSVIARFDCKDQEILKTAVILLCQKITWMSGMLYFLVATCFGAQLIVMDSFDEEIYLKSLEEFKVTDSCLYSSKLWQLFKHSPTSNYDLTCLRNIMAVDGPLPLTLVDGLKSKYGINLIPGYGMPEMTGLVLEGNSIDSEHASGCLVPQVFGKVISDRTLQKVGPKEKGEVCFKGPTMSLGYINDMKSSSMLFDKDGFWKSGHYGYYNENGHFYIIDFIHGVIKYKDFKISPRELEAIIRGMDEVRDVAVFGIKHYKDGQCPIAFVSRIQGSKLTEEEVISYVEKRVSDFKKLRGGVIFMPKIPRARDSGFVKRNVFTKVLSKYRLIAEYKSPSKSEEASTTLNEVC